MPDTGILFCKLTLQLWLMFFADYTMTNTHFFESLFLLYFVPKVTITKNCRLHNKLFAYNDFYGQRATTIYCDPVYKF